MLKKYLIQMIKNLMIGIHKKKLFQMQMQKNQVIGMKMKMVNGKHLKYQIQIIEENGHKK